MKNVSKKTWKAIDQAFESEILPGPGATPPVPEGSYELSILQSIRRIIRAVEIHSRKLTGPQLGCLLALAEEGPLTTSQPS